MDGESLSNQLANLSPEKRALLGLRLRRKGARASAEQIIPRRANRDRAPLSFGQQRLWFLDQFEPDSPLYNISKAVRLSGRLNVAALKQSLNEIVARHEVLRTTFACIDGSPVQVIVESGSIELPLIDLSDWPDAGREEEVRRLLKEEAQRPFNLASDLMLRSQLLRLAEEENVLLLMMHHIASDGWSMGVLFRELSILYEAFSNGKPSPLQELPIQYADFAVWQRQWLQGEVLEAELSYWKKRLDGVPTLQSPFDRPRPPVQSFRGARQSLMLSKTLTKELKALSRHQGVTVFMTLLAAFQTLLHRYTGQDDIVVGSPIANRNRLETEGLIGFFVNTLVLLTDLSGNPSFRDLLGRVREVALGGYAHQDLPFERLVEELQPERAPGWTPLFQVMFVLQNAPIESLKLVGLSVSPLNVDSETAKFDVNLSMWEEAEGLRGSLEYNTSYNQKVWK
ncbi:MAG: hypothetical protein HY695_11140 [Deltaproteobacteria bacterium]|nr:hypothetical protein [Deltaproteobacteria bacterium]